MPPYREPKPDLARSAIVRLLPYQLPSQTHDGDDSGLPMSWVTGRCDTGTTGSRFAASADLDNRTPEKHGNEQEIAANEFAGALLLPRRFVGETCRTGEPTFRLVRQLAEDFEVSLTATALRLVALSDEACALVYSEKGCIKWFQGSRGFQDLDVFVLVGEEVATNCMAARHFDGKICPPQPKRVKASAWFAPGDYNDDASVLEDAVALPAQNAVLSLLWIDDDLCET